jgi:RNA polymerase sigma-70 factor (ECF subfamily)
MTEPVTRPSLLARIRDLSDSQAWGQFVESYAPVVLAYALRHGLQEADADDLAQEVFRAVARAAPQLRYDPARGRFRAWLFTITRNKLRNLLAAQKRHNGDGRLPGLLVQQPAEDEAELWERECRRQLFLHAAAQVQGQFEETTWRAFWQVAVEGREPAAVAGQLGISLGAVYIAKSRVLKCLREQIDACREQELAL